MWAPSSWVLCLSRLWQVSLATCLVHTWQMSPPLSGQRQSGLSKAEYQANLHVASVIEELCGSGQATQHL